MAVYNKFNTFTYDVSAGRHNFSGTTVTNGATTHTFKVFLTNTLPSTTATTYSGISATDLATANGYTNGGAPVTLSLTTSSGVAKVTATAANPTWTATGAVGPFQYAVIYNASTGYLIAYFDYGSSITLANTETLTIAFDATNGLFTLT